MEARLLEPEAVARLVTLLPAGTAAGTTGGGGGECCTSVVWFGSAACWNGTGSWLVDCSPLTGS